MRNSGICGSYRPMVVFFFFAKVLIQLVYADLSCRNCVQRIADHLPLPQPDSYFHHDLGPCGSPIPDLHWHREIFTSAAIRTYVTNLPPQVRPLHKVHPQQGLQTLLLHAPPLCPRPQSLLRIVSCPRYCLGSGNAQVRILLKREFPVDLTYLQPMAKTTRAAKEHL